MTDVSVYDQLHKRQLWHVFPNGADSDLVRHALCNVIGWVRQRLLSATKGVEQFGESARGKEEIEVGVETQLLLTAATDKLQKVQSTWAS